MIVRISMQWSTSCKQFPCNYAEIVVQSSSTTRRFLALRLSFSNVEFERALLKTPRLHRTQKRDRLYGRQLIRRSHQRQNPLPDRLGQVGPGLDDDNEAEVNLSLTQIAALDVHFGVQLPPCGECAGLCAAWLRIGRVSRGLRPLFDSPWGYFLSGRKAPDLPGLFCCWTEPLLLAWFGLLLRRRLFTLGRHALKDFCSAEQ